MKNLNRMQSEDVVTAKLNNKFYYELVKPDNYENRISFRMNYTDESNSNS